MINGCPCLSNVNALVIHILQAQLHIGVRQAVTVHVINLHTDCMLMWYSSTTPPGMLSYLFGPKLQQGDTYVEYSGACTYYLYGYRD